MKITTQTVQIQGPVGLLEGVLDIPEKLSEQQYLSVNCHPHSLHGGSMTNKVTHTVSRSFAAYGIPSLRFNFRSVGNSQGKFDAGTGEQADLAAAVAWMQQQYPDYKLIISGFSFGSYVSAFAAKSLQPDLLLSVAPAVKRFDFSDFERPNCDWAVIMGDADELVECSEVEKWVNSFKIGPRFTNMAGASHFFHGRLLELREEVEACLLWHWQNKGISLPSENS